jgi:hypothetical protein
MLKESIHAIEIVNMIVSFLGSLVIILSSHKEVARKEEEGDQTAYLLGILSSFLAIVL